MIIRKCYLLAGVIMAVNMFTANEVKAANNFKIIGNRVIFIEKEINKQTKKEKIKKEEPKKEEKNEENEAKRIKKEQEAEAERKRKEQEAEAERIKKEQEAEAERKRKEQEAEAERIKKEQEAEAERKRKEQEEKKEEPIKMSSQPVIINFNNINNEISKSYNEKKLRLSRMNILCCFFAKPLGSLVWSFANSIYHFENIELNKVYFFKYVPCVGYRWQPEFMKESGFFFDININAVSVAHSILCTIIKYKIVSHENKVNSWLRWALAKSLFYTLPNSLNFNLNIKIKDRYFALNFAGFIAGLISWIFFPNAGLKTEKQKQA